MRRLALFAVATCLFAQAPPPIRVTPPNKAWAFELSAPGFVVKQSGPQPGGRWQLMAENGPYVLSITMEMVQGKADAAGCKDSLRDRTKANEVFELSGIKQSQMGNLSVLEYMIRSFSGERVEQKNLFGCVGKEDVFVDVHLSKAPFVQSDQTILNAILSTARIVQPAPTASETLFAEGSKFFQEKQFGKAIGPYKQALEIEKKEPTLSPSLWHILIDNLALAYGISGDDAGAESVLKYGLSKNPAYPMFYYLMADVYGERNDLKNALKYLRSALDNKSGMIPGETLPDPRTDDSFKKFVQDNEFSRLAAEFSKQ
jgi:tetratricopeptide (TPR) repeat protein